MSTAAEPLTVQHGAEHALDLIRTLASEVGARRPTSDAEAEAAQAVVAWLSERGVSAEIQPFQSYSTFAYPFGVILGASLTGALLQRGRRQGGNALALAAVAAAALEG